MPERKLPDGRIESGGKTFRATDANDWLRLKEQRTNKGFEREMQSRPEPPAPRNERRKLPQGMPKTFFFQDEEWYIRPERIPHETLPRIKYRMIEAIADSSKKRLIYEGSIRSVILRYERERTHKP